MEPQDATGAAATSAPRRGADAGTPTVTIGLAVRNGEPFVEAAIDSLLGQTFPDFELIISDNESTDRTGEIFVSKTRESVTSDKNATSGCLRTVTY